MPIAALDQLPEPRQRAVLRAWIAGLGLPAPPGRTLAALQRDRWQAAADRVPCARWGDVRVYRYRGRLYAERSRPLPAREARCWHTAESIDLGDAGRLELASTVGQGSEPCPAAGAARVAPAPWRRALPAGAGRHTAGRCASGCRSRACCRGCADHVPLVYAGDELVCVGGSRLRRRVCRARRRGELGGPLDATGRC